MKKCSGILILFVMALLVTPLFAVDNFYEVDKSAYYKEYGIIPNFMNSFFRAELEKEVLLYVVLG